MSDQIAGLATDLVPAVVNANPSPDDALTEFLGDTEEPSSARLAILAKIIFGNGLGYKEVAPVATMEKDSRMGLDGGLQ
jgi:hypothetical protein